MFIETAKGNLATAFSLFSSAGRMPNTYIIIHIISPTEASMFLIDPQQQQQHNVSFQAALERNECGLNEALVYP